MLLPGAAAGRLCGLRHLLHGPVQHPHRGSGRSQRLHRFQPPERGAEHHPLQHHHCLWQQWRCAFQRVPGSGHRPEHEHPGREPHRDPAPPAGRGQRCGGRVPELHRQQLCPLCGLCAADPYLRHLRHRLPQARAGLCGGHGGPAAGLSDHCLPAGHCTGGQAGPFYLHPQDRQRGSVRLLHLLQRRHPAPEHQGVRGRVRRG